MGPVEGSGVAVGHPHEALAAQHCLDGAVPCSWILPLQGAVGGYWQPAQHHLPQPAGKQACTAQGKLEPLSPRTALQETTACMNLHVALMSWL